MKGIKSKRYENTYHYIVNRFLIFFIDEEGMDKEWTKWQLFCQDII